MYITLMPVILAGICNMFFTKTSFYKKYRTPIDCYRCLRDGKRVLGDNKTFIGFLGMMIFGMVMQVMWGAICQSPYLIGRNAMYSYRDNTFWFNAYVGLLLGAAYVICELPNSFVKRRIDIVPGKTGQGIKGAIFFIMDQIDSLIGIVFVLSWFTSINLVQCGLYLLLGAGTHVGVNWILYILKVRKNL